MFVCVVSLSEPSSRDLLYVKCLCVLSRYLSPVAEICYMFNVCVCVVQLSEPSSRDLLYVKCLCVLSRYLGPVAEIWIILLYYIWDVHVPEKKKMYKETYIFYSFWMVYIGNTFVHRAHKA